MCGRYSIRKPVTKTADLVKTNIKVEDTDNYNAHPTQKLPVIKSYSNGKALELYEWGLVPSWSKKLDKFSPLINARRETLLEKVTFKNLIQTSRCIIPADGYYEWKREEKTKTPYYFTKEDEELIYNITKALWNDESRKLMDVGHAKGKTITPDTALSGVGVPLHPGAEKFYKEAGLIN